MKLTYDATVNIAYIRFKKKAGRVRTVNVSDELNVDLAPDGTVYGLELLNANKQLGFGKRKKFVVENASGKSLEMALGT